MRISFSLFFAAVISFSLLLIMTQLVSQQELPPPTNKPWSDSISLLPPDKPTPESNRKKLPEQAKPNPIPEVAKVLLELPRDSVDRSLPTTQHDGKPDFTGIYNPDTPWSPDNGEQGTELSGNQGLIPIAQFQPIYPREPAARGIEGWVTLRFEVRQDGTVGNVNVVAANPRGAFDNAARQAVQRWRYKPTEQGPVVQTVTLDFKLEND